MVRIAVAFVASLVGFRDVAATTDHDGFHVTSPVEGMTVIADRSYTVKWTGSFARSYVEIDLYYCGDACKEDECGEWVTSLCPYGERGCPDNEGDYDVVMPEPMAGTRGGTYKVGIMDVSDVSNWSCSGGFKLLEAEDFVADEDAHFLPGITVISPEEGDVAYTGEEYTVLFDYYSEVGSTVGRFNIDLYDYRGEGVCGGSYVTSLCDKPSIGCKDSRGDYDIVMADVPTGRYTIRVSDFDDPSTYDCSGVFHVVSETYRGDEDDDVDSKDTSLSYYY